VLLSNLRSLVSNLSQNVDAINQVGAMMAACMDRPMCERPLTVKGSNQEIEQGLTYKAAMFGYPNNRSEILNYKS
jgi:hypothetical protein